MFSSIRRHLSYANVVATMALLFAMGGSALAANHFAAQAAKTKSREFGYVITSIDQISPKVQAKLKKAAGKPSRAGPAGATGAPGAIGSQGPAGASGAGGTPGVEGVRGEQGTAGVRGEQGTSGIQGAPGEKGETGEPGLSVLSKSEQETLKSVLPYVKYVATGVGGKPTILLSGANVQIVNGEGTTQTTNGAGNLILGYDENPNEEAQTGSHDLLVGPEDRYTSYGAIIGGRNNKALAPYTLLAGVANDAEGEFSVVTGGRLSTASGKYSSVSGGQGNIATATDSSVSGGEENKAEEEGASVSGGYGNKATGILSSVSGGFENTAGVKFSSIFGGKELKTTAEYEAIP
jgi:hypothetical protein